MPEQTPVDDNVAVFEKAARCVQRIMSQIRQEQADDATPCTLWTVRHVMNHVIGGAEVLAGSLEGRLPDGDIGGLSPNSSYSGETEVGKLAAAYATEVGRILAAARQPGALQGPTPGGMMTVPQFLVAMATDHIIHGWDLARATGQDETLDPDVVQVCYATMTSPEGSVLVNMGRMAGFLGAPVSVDDRATLQDKLIAHMGRQP